MLDLRVGLGVIPYRSERRDALRVFPGGGSRSVAAEASGGAVTCAVAGAVTRAAATAAGDRR